MTLETAIFESDAKTQPNSARSNQCPFDHEKLSRRMVANPAASNGCAFAQISAHHWKIYSYEIAKRILRGNQTRQAGFNAELIHDVPDGFIQNQPVLFQDGPEHTQQRTEIARFFTPRTVNAKYRQMMEVYADELLDELHQRGRAELSVLTMKMACAVAGQIIGLTDSLLPRMHKRLDAFFEMPAPEKPQGRWDLIWLRNTLFSQFRMLNFYIWDVWPAIRKRRSNPQEDVISHLIEKEYSNTEILIECITYASAGMVTTREFITAAIWHMLQNDELRNQYLNSEESERYQILEEILRVEPVVASLLRRASEDIELEEGGEITIIRAGDIIELDIPTINSDRSIVGEAAECIVPLRSLGKRVQPPVMAFGDGHHRCPGAYVAIQETDIVLYKLLKSESLHLTSEPTLDFNEVVKGYEIRNFWVAI